MKFIITESQYKRYLNLKEGVKFSEATGEKRYKLVAEKVIQFMNFYNMKVIPRYRFLQNINTTNDLGFNMKTLLSKNLRQGEYDGYVKPLIKK